MPDNYLAANMVQSVKGCARCGGDHKDLKFETLLMPIILEHVVYDWWALCPNTRQPILCAYVDDDSEMVNTRAKT